jgi:hypothetical protein
VSKTLFERALKKQNRTGLIMSIDDPEINYDPPTHVRRRWGWAIPWEQGICYRGKSPFAWPKHLYTANGVCRRCGWRKRAK